jgi:Cu-Zn family superoxide dismutase
MWNCRLARISLCSLKSRLTTALCGGQIMKIQNVAVLVALVSALGCERTDEPVREVRPETPATPPNVIPEPNAATVPTTDSPQANRTAIANAPDLAPGGATNTEPTPPAPGDAKREAEADFKAADGVEIKGEAKLEEIGEGVRVKVRISDATPGVRGIHIHERGDCSDIPGKSMGEHFAPKGHKHGLPGQKERHLGDLGNITVAQDGTGVLDITIPEANLRAADRMSLLDKAVVIHQSEDVGKGPSGNAGTPVACAVIEKS